MSPRQQHAASNGAVETKLRTPSVLPSPQSLFSSGSQRPFQMPLHLGWPLPQRMAQPLPTWPSGIPSPPSLLSLASGQGLAHLPAFSCLAVTHGVLMGSPFLAGVPLELLGVVLGFVGAPWSCLLPSRWKLTTGLQVPSEQSSAVPRCQVPQWGFLCNRL